MYMDFVSKNSSGKYKKLHIANRVVPAFACPQADECCPVHVLDLYFSKMPQEAFSQDILNHLKCIWWYNTVPIDKNILEKMCSHVGIEGRVTNKPSLPKCLKQLGVHEKVIQERGTGLLYTSGYVSIN